MSSDQDKHEPQGFDEPITPVDFTPVEGPLKRQRFRPRPAHYVITAALLCFALAGWFVLSARSVFIDVTPVNSDVDISGGLALRVGPRFLVLPGEVRLQISADGYYEYSGELSISRETSQSYRYELLPLPGYLTLTSTPAAATVFIDGEQLGTTPLEDVELAAGEHTLALRHDRYQDLETRVDIEGRETEQDLAVTLEPDWATFSFETDPPGATVFIDDEPVGNTPLETEILSGQREMRIKLAAHKEITRTLDVEAMQDRNLPTFELEAADGLVYLRSNPGDAGVLLNGDYRGQTPLEIEVTPEQDHTLTFFRSGYEQTSRDLRVVAEEEQTVEVTLPPVTHPVTISATPEDADLYVDGEYRGKANQQIDLLATAQTLEVRKEGYVPFETEFTARPGLEQQLDVSLITLEQQRLNSIEPRITTAAGQRMRLLYPATFTMGASRREAGRQANEVLRDVTLTRPFYIAETEVTNAQFGRFDSEHSSGVVEGHTLSNNNQPVVQVSWKQAALFCNWLSDQDDLAPFYVVENDEITGINPDSTGYRLPTEAEWAWSARVAGDPDRLLKFPWGNELPPPEEHGNYADLSAASILNRIISNYDDGYTVTAPVASFTANHRDLYDMGGNVAEWVHDYYGTTGQLGGDVQQNPLGPEQGNYHVIRGSSWAHGTITELRLSFRDYGSDGRDDVGFRIARYLE